MNNLYHFALLLHISGFTLLVGATAAAFICLNRLWKNKSDTSAGLLLYLRVNAGLTLMAKIGGVSVITAGITMILIIVQAGPVVPQSWFQIKILLVILLLLNILFWGTRNTRRLRKVLRQQEKVVPPDLERLRKSLQLFYSTQLLIMFTIFILSTFRFM